MMKRLSAAMAVALWLPLNAQAGDMNMAEDAYKCDDFWTAFTEFMSLAEEGNAYAQYMVGLMHWNGEAVPMNAQEAAKWFVIAAENGEVDAQYRIGNLYYKGDGVDQDLVQAHFWYSVAAESSHYTATKLRDKLAAELQPTQLAEAEQLVRDWQPKTH